MAKKYQVCEGFIVAGKTAGETITAADVERIDILLESGRIIPVAAKSSDRMKPEPLDVPQEDDLNG